MKKAVYAVLTVFAVSLFPGNLFAQTQTIKVAPRGMGQVSAGEIMVANPSFPYVQFMGTLENEKKISEAKALLDRAEQQRKHAKALAKQYVSASQKKDLNEKNETIITAFRELDEIPLGAFLMFVDRYNAGEQADISTFYKAKGKNFAERYCSLPTVAAEQKNLNLSDEERSAAILALIEAKIPMCQIIYLFDPYWPALIEER